MKEDKDFEWQEDQQEAMGALKKSLTEAPALKPIDYESSGQIVLSVDSSLQGWGAILQQEEVDTKKRHPAQYESEMWASSEKKYNSGKLACRGLLKALKKFQYYLYGVGFLVEIDARTLVHQLNQPASDLPGSVVNRWLAWIGMFTFDIKHVAGRTHGGPDGLSRRGLAPEDSEDKDPEELEASMDADLAPVELENEDKEDSEDSEDNEDSEERARSDEDEDEDKDEDEDGDEEDDEEMADELKKIKKYLLTLKRPVGMSDKVYDSF